MGNVNIEIINTTKFLGTVVDSNLIWSDHIEYMTSKLNKSYFLILSLKNSLTIDCLLSIYYGIFYSHLSYNVIVWGSSPLATRLFLIQKRVIRVIFNLKYLDSCRQIFRCKSILTLTGIYLYKIMVYTYKEQNRLTKHEDIHEYNTRGKCKLYPRRHYHSFYERSPSYCGITYFNKLPDDIKSINSLNLFKRKLRAFLINGVFYSVEEYMSYS